MRCGCPDVLTTLSKEGVTMKDTSIPRGTDLPEERRQRSESSRFKPDSQTGKKDKIGSHFRMFERYKDQPPIHPSDIPTHQMTKYDRSSTSNERELDRQYYIRKALSNLAATSRTSAGTIDTSGSRGKERLMQATSGDEAAKKAVSNYTAVLEYLYDRKDHQFGSADDLRRFVEQVARNINAGITREGVLLRETDSDKFSYTPIQHLERESNQFYNELFRRLSNPDIDSVETAAWIEYRVNLTDHFFADGCGRISSALAAYVGMRAGVELPTFSERSEIFQHGPKELRTTPDPLVDKQFLTWLEYYRSKYTEI